MARILHDDEWFEEIGSRGHYESEFEKVLEQEAERLFTNYRWVRFKATVTSEDDADSRKADFALIHRTYGSWWVVEVELAHHSLARHVLPQVRTLSRASYGLDEAEYLCRSDPNLHYGKVKEMLKGEQPRVLVIVDAPVEGWAPALRPYGAMVVVCQMFRSRLNRYILRVNGDYPSDDEQVVTSCECEPLLHRLLAVHSPAKLPVAKGGVLLLYHEGRASEWQRTDTGQQVYLHALRDHALSPGRRYEIVRQGDGTLVILEALA